MKKVLAIVIGLAIIAFAIYGLVTWWLPEFKIAAEGLAMPIIALVGLVVIVMGTL